MEILNLDLLDHSIFTPGENSSSSSSSSSSSGGSGSGSDGGGGGGGGGGGMNITGSSYIPGPK